MNELLNIIEKLKDEKKEKLLLWAKKLLEEQDNEEETYFISDERELNGANNSPYYDKEKLSFSSDDIKAIVKQFPKNKKWTFTDLQNEYIFPKEHFVKIEIINFKIYVMPDPTTSHQQILTDLATFINMYVKTNHLGRTMVAPVSIKIDEGTVLKPDIIFIAIEKIEQNPDIITPQAIEAAPDLVVEVLSPANYKKRREAKKQRYAEAGVQEYWELRPKKKSITIETLEDGEYKIYSEAKKIGEIQSKVLKGFTLNIQNIFG